MLTAAQARSTRTWRSGRTRYDVAPVLLGAGLRLSDGTPPRALEELGVDDVGVRTGLRFRVVRA